VITLVPMGFVLATTNAAGHWYHDGRQLDLLGQLWLVAAGLPLSLSRRFPLPVFVAVTALTLSYYSSDYPGGPAIVFPTIALFVLTRKRGPVTAGIVAASVLAAVYTGVVVVTHRFAFDARAALLPVWSMAVVGIATAARDRMAAVHASREQAEEHRRRLAEQERLRVAREVHDVVAHSLATINVQAGVAAHVADRRPEQAKEALRNIKEASASALHDLRATLAVLRGGDLAPAPSLDRMDVLLDPVRATGLDVRVHGEPGELPAPVDAAAYRILQESLTNVVRHATDPTAISVHFGHEDGCFRLVVRDDGKVVAEPATGNGLRGMGERAAALGGRMTAGPVDGGFEVRAELPLEGTS
jgi:signal transduction histidine kinase